MGLSRTSREVEKRLAESLKDPAIWWNNRCRNCTSSGHTSILAFVEPAGKQGFGPFYATGTPGTGAETTSIQLVADLKRCSGMRDLEGGKKLHQEALKNSCDTNNYVAASLITMYSNCRSMALAQQVFDRLVERDAATWNSLILGYVHNGKSLLAMDLFTAMDCEPDHVTYVAVLKACRRFASEKESEKQICLEKGIVIHNRAKDSGFESHMFVASSLVDMYSKCGSIHRAKEVFDRMVSKDAVTWNALIWGYLQNGESLVAMDLFASMDCTPSALTYVAALKACGSLASTKEAEKRIWLEKGIAIHKRAVSSGCESDRYVVSSLVDMYSKCGSMPLAKQVFDRIPSKDVVTWTSLIRGYVQNGESLQAMELFDQMDCQPDSLVYVVLLKACGNLASEKESEKPSWLQKGMIIHKQAKDRGFESDGFVASTLVDMYSKCGSLGQARDMFDRMSFKSVVTWNVLILGYVQNGESSAALDLFNCIDYEPDTFTYVAGLKACSSLTALPDGQQIHVRICKHGMEQVQSIANILVDLYAKCGNMNTAEELFSNMQTVDTVSWNALITGYSALGNSALVFNLTKKMQQAGLQMNGITFTCALTACSHAGLVEKGKSYFDSMPGYGINLTLEHYNCMVDLLGRANRLQEALALVNSMPFQANAVTWRTLLGACRKWKNLQVGKVAFDAVVAAGAAEAAAFELMTDIYESSALLQN